MALNLNHARRSLTALQAALNSSIEIVKNTSKDSPKHKGALDQVLNNLRWAGVYLEKAEKEI